jgi:hypothetical protein
MARPTKLMACWMSVPALKRSCTALAALLSCTQLVAQSLPTGPCSFLSDSGGSTADSGTSISLTFDGRGGLSFSGSGSVQVQDIGTYSVSGNSIVVSLPGVGKSAHGQWNLSANTLRLPFQLFSNDAGSSLWSCIAAASNFSSGGGPGFGGGGGSHSTGGASGSGGQNGNGRNSGKDSDGHENSLSATGNKNDNGPNGPTPSPNNPPPDPPSNPPSNPPNTPPDNNPPNSSPGNPPNRPPNNPPNTPPNRPNSWQNSPVAPYVGDWVGIGWGWEVRFRSGDWNGHPDEKNSVMTLTVRHLARFDFTVDTKGQVVGNGEVTYDLDPNLCGVYRAAEQINTAIDVLKNFNGALSKMRSYATQINNIFGMKSQIEASEAKDKIESWKKFKNANSDQQFGVAQTHTSPWSNMGHNAEDTGDLAVSVWYERCSKGAPVTIVGGLTCEDLLGGPPLTVPGEVKSTGEKLAEFAKDQGKDLAKDAWKKLQEKDPGFWNHDASYLYTTVAGEAVDAAADALKEKAIKTLNVFDVQEQPGKDECAGIPSTRTAGSSFNTPTAERLMASWKELGDSIKTMNPDAAVNVLMNAPGVTKVQYDYKGLEHGPESRRFKVRGYVDGNRIVLRKDGDVYGGDTNLTVQYTVNMVTSKQQFPTWSPFIDNDSADLATSGKVKQLERKSVTCDVKSAKGGKAGSSSNCTPHEELVTTISDSSTPFATYYKSGEHRNGVKVWHEYEYYWNAYKVTEPLSITEK